MESSDTCIFCGPGECQCIAKKKRPAKPRPKKKSGSSPPIGGKAPASKPKPAARLDKPEHKPKGTARPERDQQNLVSTERHKRSEEASDFWAAMTVLFNEGMLHEISVRRSLDAYPSIPGGLYE